MGREGYALSVTPETPAELIGFALKQDREAVEWFLALRGVLHFWDDLIDGDNLITAEQVNTNMFVALVKIPCNGFYQRHQASLSPLLVSAIANWSAANNFERQNDDRLLQLAFVIRSDYANLLIHAAYLVGGYEWMLEVTPQIRTFWTSEDFVAYKSNLGREKADRTGQNDELVRTWYEQETQEYLNHGLTVFNGAMLADTEEGHVQKLAEMIGMTDGQTVIDMGCGVGGVSRWMKSMFPASEFFGVTNVNAQIEAMYRMDGVIPVRSDYHNVSISSGVADVVMFNESIGYGRLDQLIQEAARLLKPGGLIAIKDGVSLTGKTEWSSLWRWTSFERGLIDKVAQEQGLEIIKSDEHEYSLERYIKFISESNLMRSRYGLRGLCHGPKHTSWFWLIKKPGEQHVL